MWIEKAGYFTENEYLDISIDIHRIENNIKYLADRLNELGYKNDCKYNKNSHKALFIKVLELNRLRENVNKIGDAFHWFKEMERILIDKSQKQFINYIDINKLEKNLKITKEHIKNVDKGKACGEIICGNNMVL